MPKHFSQTHALMWKKEKVTPITPLPQTASPITSVSTAVHINCLVCQEKIKREKKKKRELRVPGTHSHTHSGCSKQPDQSGATRDTRCWCPPCQDVSKDVALAAVDDGGVVRWCTFSSTVPSSWALSWRERWASTRGKGKAGLGRSLSATPSRASANSSTKQLLHSGVQQFSHQMYWTMWCQYFTPLLQLYSQG